MLSLNFIISSINMGGFYDSIFADQTILKKIITQIISNFHFYWVLG